jgi:hypothetical protein
MIFLLSIMPLHTGRKEENVRNVTTILISSSIVALGRCLAMALVLLRAYEAVI